MYSEIEVSSNIPIAKLRRAYKTGVLSLTKDQLHGSGATLAVHPETAMKVQKAKRANRGVHLLITPHEIEYPMDTGVLSKLADAAVAPASAYTGNPGAVMASRQGLKSLTGIGIEQEGGRLSLADVKTAGSKALAYAKRKGLITDAVDLVEKKLIEKAERPEHVDLIRQVRKGVRTKFGVGVGQKKKLVKGSADAKAHMAALRAMRKSGGSFRLF
ncbi:unnamed protein product [Phytophthora fragariaefolia]|uniref:Unnamed protein product n=1 Tax=Phytophthora fragariaefolia TaxID=1490495 RepID=A0A9W7CJW2_9STRA|nr:unnamed protein product [Phytophthora fragariaefolia]